MTSQRAGGGVLINEVTHSFPSRTGGSSPVLRDVSLEIAEGEFAAIVGPSGCGKSTLLNLISGLIAPTRGHLAVGGDEVAGVRTDVGYMPARDALLPWRTAIKNVEFALELQHAMTAKERRDRARELLAIVGLGGFESYYPFALSAGMRQRVAIARTFATRPAVLLLDEPFSALDAQTKLLVQDVFLGLWEQEHHTVVLITHDVVEAVSLADRVIVFTAGPGTVRATYEVDLPRPRSVQQLIFEEPVFQEHLRTIWADLRPQTRAAVR